MYPHTSFKGKMSTEHDKECNHEYLTFTFRGGDTHVNCYWCGHVKSTDTTITTERHDELIDKIQAHHDRGVIMIWDHKGWRELQEVMALNGQMWIRRDGGGNEVRFHGQFHARKND